MTENKNAAGEPTGPVDDNEDVEGHFRPDDASFFGEDHPGAAKPPRRRPAGDDDDVEGHAYGSGPLPQTGRPPRDIDR